MTGVDIHPFIPGPGDLIEAVAGAFPGVCECFQQVPCVENSDTTTRNMIVFFQLKKINI